MTRLICSHDRAAISHTAFILADDDCHIILLQLALSIPTGRDLSNKSDISEAYRSVALCFRTPDGFRVHVQRREAVGKMGKREGPYVSA